jgi:hypothetical protein
MDRTKNADQSLSTNVKQKPNVGMRLIEFEIPNTSAFQWNSLMNIEQQIPNTC